MLTRRAFARPGLLLAVVSGVGAATLLLTAEPVQAPAPHRPPGAGSSNTAAMKIATGMAQAPDADIPLSDGRKVTLAELRPGTELAEGCDFHGAAWANAQLSGLLMVAVDLRGANLQRAQLKISDLTRANLRGADLRGAQLQGAYLGDADLRGAKLEGAAFQGAHFSPGTRWPHRFNPAERGAALDMAGWDLRGRNLRRRDLRGADLREADLSRADLREANLRGAWLYHTNLTGADLRGAILAGARFDYRTCWPAGFDPAALGAHLED
jgi:uncharacterized protein YjbI with pentapeptide repeats